MTCAGGGLIPDWAPDWLRPWFAASQGIAWCGVEYLMLIEGVLFLAFLLVMLRRSEI